MSYVTAKNKAIISNEKVTIKKKRSTEFDLFNIINDFKNQVSINNLSEDNNESISNCNYCKSFELIQTNDGLLTCRDCGSIIDHVIDQGAEWRYYGCDDSKSSDPTRCGMPTNDLLPQSSLGSFISGSNKGMESYDMKKIRRYHSWNAMPYKERSLYTVFDTLQIRAINNGIPSCIVEDAKIMYKVLSETRISRGSNRKGLIASCIYYACKKEEATRSAKEIADIFKLNITDMTKGCKKFIEIWNTINKSNPDNINLTASQPNDFIQRFCSKLYISDNIIELCQYISDKSEEYSLVSENTPPSIAAGSIYLACQIMNISITKKDISEACKISEVTISKCYKKLEKYQQYIIPEEYLNKTMIR